MTATLLVKDLIDTAGPGAEALSARRARPYDCAVVDLRDVQGIYDDALLVLEK